MQNDKNDYLAMYVEKCRQLEGERDALAAHVERLNRILFDTYAAIDADDVHALPYDEYRDAYNDEPTTSLAQRDARIAYETISSITFPTMLRLAGGWSGGEVQEWLENEAEKCLQQAEGDA